MGCDIHLYIEVKIGDEWYMYGSPYVTRNYVLFEALAGVRGYTENCLVQPRGIPSDVSAVVKNEYDAWGEDAHTPSWLSVKELLDAITYIDPEFYQPIHRQLGWVGNTTLIPYQGDGIEKSYDDTALYHWRNVRVVFWFDN